MRYFSWLIAAACWSLAFAGPADARRVALVIGNGDYRVGPLDNPVNDAVAVAEAIEKQLRFDKVILKRDLGAQSFRDALREMALESRGAEVGVIYFSGHGIEIAGRNFLVPVDARLAAARDADLEAIALDTVLAQLDGVTNLKLVILDACRNNPFPFPSATRSVGSGLARIEPEGNMLVAYAAKDGTMAEDGTGVQHSPFTEALLKYLPEPGLEVRQLFGYVRDEVAEATGHRQQPYLYGSLGGQGFFLGPPPSESGTWTLASGPRVRPREAEQAWAAVKDTGSIAQLEVIATRYRGTVYADLAQARIAEIRDKETTQLAAAIPPPASTPAPPLARLIQTELQRVGCTPGDIDGVWGDKARAALARFARHAKLGASAGEPSVAALEAIKAQSGRVCPLECGPGTVEKEGACVVKASPERRVVRTAQPSRRAQPKERDKPGMCWAVDPRGRTSTLVPCSDSQAGMRAY